MAKGCHWLLLRLALLAAVLLTVLPTLGRLAQAASSTASEPIAVCTVKGVQLIAAAGQPPDGSLPADQLALHDCAYCPLLAGLLILAAIILRLLQRPPVIRPSIPAPPVANHYRLVGRGPRGPPASL